MELEELKNAWKIEVNKIMVANESQTINPGVMKTTENALNKIVAANKYWIKWAVWGLIALSVNVVVNVVLHFMMPDKVMSGNFWESFSYMVLILLFAVTTLLVCYLQDRIFVIDPAWDTRHALSTVIARFTFFYKAFVALSAVMFLGLFYVAPIVMLDGFHISLGLQWRLVISVLLTAAGLLGNHIYYMNTYFRWISDLNSSLKELSGKV